MSEDAYLDVSVIRCPYCGKIYVEASWYVLELQSDIECGVCHETFNAASSLIERLMLKFELNDLGKVKEVKIAGDITSSKSQI
ncbi:hypothetical protein J7L06_06170 [Candidatus Bathyarchaeota archaeon]|nr:hypothetical protein [Candidatus Bathyarchaeota archaeon]